MAKSKQGNRQQAISKKQQATNSSLIWSERSIEYLYLFFILLLVFAAYYSSLSNSFANWDDDDYVIKNNVIKVLDFEHIKTIFTSFYFSNYHPLTTLSYAVEYHFFQLNPTAFHVFNLIFHLINIVLVYNLIKTITSNRIASAIVALIFGIHPMHVESVAWIAERKDVLYTLFYIAALIFYVRYIKQSIVNSQRAIGKLVLTLVFFILSLLSKSAAVSLPMVLIVIDFYFKKKYDIKHIIMLVLFFIFSVAFGIITIKSQGSSGAIADLTPSFSIIERFFLICSSIAYYIYMFFLPNNLCAMHYYPVKSGGLLPFEYYIAPLFLVAIILLIFITKNKKLQKDLILGILFYLFSIILVIQIIPVGFALNAERYTYIPYIGLAFIVMQLYNYYINDKNSKFNSYKPLFIGILIVYSGYFTIMTFNRTKVWENGIVLFTDVIQKNPTNFHGYWIRGSAYSNKKDYVNSIPDFDNTLKYRPGFADAYNNRGNAKNNLKDYKGAMEDLNLAVKFKPDLAEAYSNLGNVKDNLGDLNGALVDLNKAISMKPEMVTAYNNRGVIKGKMGKFDDAINDFNTAIKINPYDASAYLNRGNAKGFLKDFQGSIKDFNIAISLSNEESETYYNRGMSKYYIKDLSGACSDWEIALKMGNPDADMILKKYCK